MAGSTHFDVMNTHIMLYVCPSDLFYPNIKYCTQFSPRYVTIFIRRYKERESFVMCGRIVGMQLVFV